MDLITELRRASSIAMKADTAILAIVPKARIFGYASPLNPVWPFIKHGVPVGRPREATCLKGEDIRHTVIALVGPRMSGQSVLETGEDHAGRLSAAIKRLLHNRTLLLPEGNATLRYINEQRLEEAEADTWRIVVEFRARVSA